MMYSPCKLLLFCFGAAIALGAAHAQTAATSQPGITLEAVTYGTPVVIVRPVMIYGPGQPPEKLLPTVITALLRGEAPKMSNGLFAPDWVYIDDLIDGLVGASYIPGAEGCTLDLGSGTLTPVREMVRRIVTLVRERRGTCPEPLIGALPDRPNEAYDPANTGHALEKLDWRATTSLDDGLRKTIEALETGLKRQ